MHDERPSQTAGYVAAWRGLAPWLPEGGQLASDPFGLAFAPTAARPLVELAARAPRLTRAILSRGPLHRMLLWLQLRTRALDDLLLAFVQKGGRQVILLGAGFDCRASRLDALIGSTVFEIDHPATQGKKRAVLSHSGTPTKACVEYLSWNFERDPLDQLGARLASLGHDSSRPTFTIWEGVIPYLTEPAIAATVNAVREWSRPRQSQLAFTYLEPHELRGAGSWQRAVRLLGEPWRFGWEAHATAPWMAAHGMRVVSDESDADLARRLLPPHLRARLGPPGRRVALAVSID